MIAMVYGGVCYLVFFASFLWAMAWVGDVGGPKTIDSGAAGDVVTALLVDAALLGLFAVQHSVMARPAFKERWTRIVPKAVERSTYVLAASLALLLLLWQWRPLPTPIWSATSRAPAAALTAGYWAGWLIVLLSTFMINHFELFGLSQAWRAWRRVPPPPTSFVQRWLYRYVRHPIMLGFLVAFWSAPVMTVGHLVFALATTAYVLAGTRLEERDLEASLGDAYRDYRRNVPMLVPLPKRASSSVAVRPVTR